MQGVPGVYGPKGDSGYKVCWCDLATICTDFHKKKCSFSFMTNTTIFWQGILGNPGQPGRDGDPGIEV